MVARILVIAAFLAGVAAFFLPFMKVTAAGVANGEVVSMSLDVSVMQIFQGAAGLESAAGGIQMSDAQRKEVDSTMNQFRGVLLIPFAPTALFLIIALLGIKRFGRGLGVFALIVGLIGVGGWALITAAAEGESKNLAFGIGLTLILVGGALGTVGGIAGIAKPQKKAAA